MNSETAMAMEASVDTIDVVDSGVDICTETSDEHMGGNTMRQYDYTHINI